MKKEKTVSLCMIVKNEEKYLGKCLGSVKELVDEIIIVDTGSTDATVSIAQKFGAKVVRYEWDNNFSNARNFSLSFAKNEWILLMDGDDEFNSEDKEKFIRLVNTSEKDGHYFRTLSYIGIEPGQDIVFNLNLRLLRNNKKYKFTLAIHEQITPVSGKMDYTNFSDEDIRIFHYGYLNHVAVDKNKRKRNISIIKEELQRDPYSRFNLFNLGNEYFALGDMEKALELFNSVYENISRTEGFAPKLVVRRVMCLDEIGRYEQALEAVEQGLNMYPNFSDLEFIRGCIYHKTRRYTLAMDCFRKCIEMGSPPAYLEFLNGCGTYRPYQGLGQIYLDLQDYEKALDYFERCLKFEISPDYILSKITKVLNKMCANKRYVSFKLSQYFDLEKTGHLLRIADLLIKEGLYDIAAGYIEKAGEMECDNDKILFLKGKALFYQKAYRKAETIFLKLSAKNNPEMGILKYLFVCNLIEKSTQITSTLQKIEKYADRNTYKAYLQCWYIFKDKGDIVFTPQENQERILQAVIEILEELLKIQEFIIFEKLLPVFNCMDSNRVLLQLGKLYYRNCFEQMAVQEILRSIKDFNVVDAEGIEILYRMIV